MVAGSKGKVCGCALGFGAVALEQPAVEQNALAVDFNQVLSSR